jgi:hypothetical protein
MYIIVITVMQQVSGKYSGIKKRAEARLKNHISRNQT